MAALASVAAVALAGCSSTKTASNGRTKSKEYFAESAYGVKASPRVTNKRSNLRRGGGRDQTGKPYKVAGKWYYPKEDKNYHKVGSASWYGDAFHGRLTANGEVYDMTHLTAAHPTMPLPSYARVTNKTNGSSVIVRVNDRGPFHGGRIIDLSKRAAQLLDYTHSGVAKVEVEYIGRAPLHGRDDQFLMASYRPGGGAPHPGDNIATGVMVAMNGSTPTSHTPDMPVTFASASPQNAPLPGVTTVAAASVPASAPFATVMEYGYAVVLPEFGPIVPERPPVGYMVQRQAPPATLHSYADTRIERAAAVLNDFADAGLTADAVASSWRHGQASTAGEYVSVGTFSSEAEARIAARKVEDLGSVVIAGMAGEFGVEIHAARQGQGLDGALQSAWERGFTDAMTIRQ